MKFEVYCDESHPDVFWSTSRNRATYSLIGSLWLPAVERGRIKDALKLIKFRHGFHGEIKWQKVTSRNEALFVELIELYATMNSEDILRFRCIVIEAAKMNLMKFHQNDAELGFHKFYYQMLHHWILDYNEYQIFCDQKTNRERNRLAVLHKVLKCANMSSTVASVQALPSSEVDLLQLTDVLLGMVSSRFNDSTKPDSPRARLIARLEQRLGISRLLPTSKGDVRFNIFKIRLDGGW